jgi:hypothetical protein
MERSHKIRVLSFGVIALCVRNLKIYFLFTISVSHWGVLPRPDHVSPFGPLYLGAKVAGFFVGVVAAFDGVTSLMMMFPFMCIDHTSGWHFEHLLTRNRRVVYENTSLK